MIFFPLSLLTNHLPSFPAFNHPKMTSQDATFTAELMMIMMMKLVSMFILYTIFLCL